MSKIEFTKEWCRDAAKEESGIDATTGKSMTPISDEQLDEWDLACSEVLSRTTHHVNEDGSRSVSMMVHPRSLSALIAEVRRLRAELEKSKDTNFDLVRNFVLEGKK